MKRFDAACGDNFNTMTTFSSHSSPCCFFELVSLRDSERCLMFDCIPQGFLRWRWLWASTGKAIFAEVTILVICKCFHSLTSVLYSYIYSEVEVNDWCVLLSFCLYPWHYMITYTWDAWNIMSSIKYLVHSLNFPNITNTQTWVIVYPFASFQYVMVTPGCTNTCKGDSPVTDGFPSHQASDVEFWRYYFVFVFGLLLLLFCFVCSFLCWSEHSVGKIVKYVVIWDAMMLMWHHFNVISSP